MLLFIALTLYMMLIFRDHLGMEIDTLQKTTKIAHCFDDIVEKDILHLKNEHFTTNPNKTVLNSFSKKKEMFLSLDIIVVSFIILAFLSLMLILITIIRYNACTICKNFADLTDL